VLRYALLGHPSEHPDREARSGADLACRGDAAAHQRTELLAQGETQPRSLVFGRLVAFHLTEITEEPLEIIRRDTYPGVPDLNFDPVSGLIFVALGRQNDGSVLGELRRIAHQVQRRLAQLGLIGRHDAEIASALYDQLVPVGFDHRLNVGDYIADHLVQIELRDREIDDVRFDAREIENVGDERKKMLSCRIDPFKIDALRAVPPLELDILEEDLAEADHRVEGRP